MRLAILFKHPLKALKYLEGQSSQHITLDHQRTFLQTLWGVSRGWGSIIVWGTVDLEQSEQRKKDRR